MESQVKEKKKRKSRTVSMSLRGIPKVVHDRILLYKTEITGRDRRDYNVKEAYVKFLEEKSQSIA